MNPKIKKAKKFFEIISIDNSLLEVAKCGIWFKSVGGQAITPREEKEKLMWLNTYLQNNKISGDKILTP